MLPDPMSCSSDLGSVIHQQYMKASTTDWKQSVEDAKSAVLIWALKEKTEAVKNALLVAEQQKNKELEALKNKHLIVLKEEIKKTEIRMRWQYQQEAKKQREAAEQHLAREIQQTLEKCAAEKEKAIFETILEQTDIAAHNLEDVVSVLKINAVIQQEAVVQQSLKKMEAEYEKKIVEEVERVHKEEKVEAEAPIILLQSRHQSEIDYLKHMLCDKEESLKEIYKRVETMTILEMELENELRETRSAFQDYINLTYPKLPPEQVQFILPPRRMCQNNRNPPCSIKPHKAQKRPQK